MRTILIADDEPAVLSILAHVFQASGYQPLKAPNGLKAIELAEANHVDAALLDINMPGANGFTVAAMLREIAHNRGRVAPAVWIMTGAHTHDAVARSKDVGARSLLRKPFELASLVREINAALEPEKPAAATTEPGPARTATDSVAVG